MGSLQCDKRSRLRSQDLNDPPGACVVASQPEHHGPPARVGFLDHHDPERLASACTLEADTADVPDGHRRRSGGPWAGGVLDVEGQVRGEEAP